MGSSELAREDETADNNAAGMPLSAPTTGGAAESDATEVAAAGTGAKEDAANNGNAASF